VTISGDVAIHLVFLLDIYTETLSGWTNFQMIDIASIAMTIRWMTILMI
jgi:hypothetical protein